MKIITYAKAHWSNIYFAIDCDTEYISQVLDYSEGEEPDDACFVAGTRIATLKGDKNIEDVKIGDYVITPYGLDKVISAGTTGIREVVKNIGLVGTRKHKIFNKLINNFSPLDSLTSIISCDIISLRGLIKWQILKQLYLTIKNIEKLQRTDIISISALIQKEKIIISCIELFGNIIIKKQFLKGTMCIIKILIKTIMIFLIWKFYQVANISHCMVNIFIKVLSIKKKIGSGLKLYVIKLKRGIKAILAENGINNTLGVHCQKHGNIVNKRNVSSVIKVILQKLALLCIVLKYAGIVIVMDMVEFIKKHVNTVIRYTKQNKQKESSAQTIAKACTVIGKKKVYNLKVENSGVYYANGILVSNCDSLASLIRQMIDGYLIRLDYGEGLQRKLKKP